MSGEKDRRPYIVVTLDFFDHPKTLAVSEAARLHVLNLWAYCNRQRTDGQVPEAVLNARGVKVARELVDAGFVEEREGAWWCHDYLDHQKSREEIAAHVEKKRARQSNGAAFGQHNRWHVKRGILNPECRFCAGDLPPDE